MISLLLIFNGFHSYIYANDIFFPYDKIHDMDISTINDAFLIFAYTLLQPHFITAFEKWQFMIFIRRKFSVFPVVFQDN